MHKQPLFVAILSFLSLSLNAQNNDEPLNSGEVLEQCVKYYEEGNYKKVIAACKTVSRNDTNYKRVLHELSYASYLDSQFDNSVSYARLGMAAYPEKAVDWYNLLGNSYDGLGKTKEALASYDSLLTCNPYNYQGWFNKGLVYYHKDNFADAKTCFEKALMINPYHPSSHYFLGACAVKDGKVVPAMLSFSTCLLMGTEGKYAGNCVKFLSSIANAADDITKYTASPKQWSDDDFDLLQEIVISKIALNAKYKLKTDLEDPITRQLQVIMEKLEYNEADKGFWMQYYVPFFTDVYKKGSFNVMVNYMFSGLDIKAVKSYNQKNKKEINAFANDAGLYFTGIRRTGKLMVNERTDANKKYYFSDGYLLGIGSWTTVGSEDQLTGPWTFYFENGNVKSKGTFDASGEKTGEWSYYHENGQLKQTCPFADGKIHGKVYSWYDNGNPSEENEYKNDKLNGPTKVYYYNGLIKRTSNYSDDKREGEEKGYTYDGFPDYVAIYKNDELDGEVTGYHNNGKVHVIKHYTNGKLNGLYKVFAANGTLTQEGIYADDELAGEWKEYYDDKKIKSEYAYKDSKLTGLYKTYYENGKPRQIQNYNNGKVDGKEENFDEDGIKFSESIYENGRLRELSFFDKKGNAVNNFTTRRGAGNLTFYNAHGTKTDEGYFNKDGYREGKTTYYYASGKVRTEANFKDGLLQGERTIYYTNGKVSEKINFENDNEQGILKGFHINGNKRYSGYYNGGSKEAEHITYNLFGTPVSSFYYLDNDQNGYTVYYSANGKKDYEELYKNGWLCKAIQYDTMGNILAETDFPKGNGDLVYKHYNGKVYIKSAYRNYMVQGNYEAFFFDGTPNTFIHYKNGYRDSLSKTYFYGGKVRSEGRYNMGDKTGEWKYYYSNGKLNYIENYIDGEEEGTEILYNDDGTKDRVITYHKGNLEGPYIYYGDNNEPALQLNYHNDEVVSYTYNGKDGKLLAPIPVKNGTVKIVAYYSNGNKSVEVNYENNEIDGVRKFYHTNGELFVESAWVHGYQHGPRKVYYTGNKKQREEEYYYGNQHGVARSYFPNGKVRLEENWYNGELNGPSKLYDETGKLKETRVYYYDLLVNVIKE